jgi:hypothetical protein
MVGTRIKEVQQRDGVVTATDQRTVLRICDSNVIHES